MPTITAAVHPAARSAEPTLVPTTARYENWRPPAIGVSLLIPVGTDELVVADLLGSITLPTGAVHYGHKTLEQATQDVLWGVPDGLPLLRRVALAWVQARRRQVITHVMATEPMTPETVGHLIYRDPRADVRVLPITRILDSHPVHGRIRISAALQSLATGETAYIEGGVVRPSAPAELIPDFPIRLGS
ncbi:hypothetical protein ACW4TU_41230 [Streptomyces sp. QTS52]